MRLRACLLLVGVTMLSAPTAVAKTIVVDGRGYIDVGGGAWVPQGDFARQGSPASAWSVQFGAGLKRLPFTLGLGAGVISAASRSDPGPTGFWVHDGGIDFGPTTITRLVELRHVEVVARLEPDWQRVRPFLEVTGGVFQYWTTTSMSADWTGGVLNATEHAHDIGPALGFGGGLILSPFPPLHVEPGPDGTGGGGLAFALTLGVRMVRGGDIKVASFDTPDGQSSTLVPAHSSLSAVAPYALLTMTFRSPDAK